MPQGKSQSKKIVPIQQKKSYSQRKREKLDYRAEYFRHNPGMFGYIWFCAYCHKPLLRSQVQVDHIVPLNNVAGRNARYNLVAACEKCNKAKSDKIDERIVKGYCSKVLEVIMFTVQKVIAIIFMSTFFCGLKIIDVIWNLLLAPFKQQSMAVKLAVLIIYLCCFLFLYYQYFVI